MGQTLAWYAALLHAKDLPEPKREHFCIIFRFSIVRKLVNWVLSLFIAHMCGYCATFPKNKHISYSGLICKMMYKQPDYVSAVCWTTALLSSLIDINTLSPDPRMDNFLVYYIKFHVYVIIFVEETYRWFLNLCVAHMCSYCGTLPEK